MGPRGRDHRAPHRRARAVDDAAALAARRRPLARRGGLRLGLPDPQLAARARAGVRWVRGEPDRLQPPVDVRRPRGFAARVVLKTPRSEEHTSELQSLMSISYAVFCLKKKKRLQQY